MKCIRSQLPILVSPVDGEGTVKSEHGFTENIVSTTEFFCGTEAASGVHASFWDVARHETISKGKMRREQQLLVSRFIGIHLEDTL